MRHQVLQTVLKNPTTNHVSYIFANIQVWNYGHQGEVDGGNFLLDQFHLFYVSNFSNDE